MLAYASHETRAMNYQDRITRDPQILGGEPVITGTRIPLRTVLASHEGRVAWDDAVASLPRDERWLLVRLSWGWTNPIMSFVLSPQGRVTSVIVTFDDKDDPRFTDPDNLPGGPRFDTTIYRAALLRQSAAAAGSGR